MIFARVHPFKRMNIEQYLDDVIDRIFYTNLQLTYKVQGDTMKTRTIKSIEPGQNISFSESIVVTGDVGVNSVLKVTGNLKYK